MASSKADSLRHSRSRINAYRALASPSLIALSSKDPILTAFELSKELSRMSIIESEFTVDYQVQALQLCQGQLWTTWCQVLYLNWKLQQLEEQCQKFATSLLDHVRSSYELETLLNYSHDSEDVWEPGERQTLDRLELAIKYTQKDVSFKLAHFETANIWLSSSQISHTKKKQTKKSLWLTPTCNNCWGLFGIKVYRDSDVDRRSVRSSRQSKSRPSFPFTRCFTWSHRRRSKAVSSRNLSSNSFVTRLPISSFSVTIRQTMW